MSVRILHLTDLHLGKGHVEPEDMKQKLTPAQREPLIDRLTQYVESLSSKPDYVVISGDLTNRGDEDGMKQVKRWILDQIKKGTLPSEEKVLVVPGNHDVKWYVPESPGWHAERYRSFFENIGRVFPHSYLPECDPSLDHRQPEFNPRESRFGGLATKSEHGEIKISHSYPFILDLERDVLLFAFNSTLGCGIFVRPDKDMTAQWDGIMRLFEKNQDAIGQLKQLREAYTDALKVDAGIIGDEQLRYFSDLMKRLRKQLGERYASLTKIAILHHHIGHLWNQQLEIKNFESTIDAHPLKKRLVEFGFDLVLHGHKHTNHVGIDATVIPVSSTRRLNPLCIISGGTVCGNPPLQEHQTFKIIDLVGDKGPRIHATVCEVPLKETGDHASVIENESVMYNIPIAPKFPELHELDNFKKHFDEFLLERYVRKPAEKSKITIAYRIELPRAHKDLVAREASYQCTASGDAGNQRWFYEVVLATKRLDFRQYSRIYWLLRDVKAFAEQKQLDCRVVLIVGDLEKTHFRESTKDSEVATSILKLQKWFQPAIANKMLTVKVHRFKQSDVDGLSKGIADHPADHPKDK